METKETIEINDLALAEDQQIAVKGGPIVMEDCLISSYQTGGHDGGATLNQGTSTSGPGVYKSVDSGSTWTL